MTGFSVLAVSDGGSGGLGGSSGGVGGAAGVVVALVLVEIVTAPSFHGNNEVYLNLLAKYPVLTKAVTSATLTPTGDLICQLVVDQVPSLDLKRTFIFTLLGLVLVGPTLHFWYLYLSKLVTMPGASGAFLCLLVDQW